MKLLIVYLLIETQLIASRVDAGDQLNCRQIRCLALNCHNASIVRLCPEMCIRCIDQRRMNRKRTSSAPHARRPSINTHHYASSQPFIRSVRLPLPYFGSLSQQKTYQHQQESTVDQLRSIVTPNSERAVDNNMKQILVDMSRQTSRPLLIVAADPIDIMQTNVSEIVLDDDSRVEHQRVDTSKLFSSMQRTTVAIPDINRKSIQLPFAELNGNNVSTNNDESIISIHIRQPNETIAVDERFVRYDDERVTSSSSLVVALDDNEQQSTTINYDHHTTSSIIVSTSSIDDQQREHSHDQHPIEFSVANLRANYHQHINSIVRQSNVINGIPQRFIVKLRKNIAQFHRHSSNESNRASDDLKTTNDPFDVSTIENNSSTDRSTSDIDREMINEQISYLGSILQL